MSAQAALLWDALPTILPKPRPVERVWTLRSGSDQMDAELRGHGEWGWECQLLLNGNLLYGRRWALKSEAAAAASEKRQDLLARGWELVGYKM